MPESQRMRPAVKVVRAPKASSKAATASAAAATNDVKKKLNQATKLEEKLKHLSKKANSEEACKLSAQLVGLFGSIIVDFPHEARNNDCIGRMFNMCFYSRVKLFRSILERQRRKDGKERPEDRTHFDDFLQESVQTFTYLLDQYLSKLSSTKPEDTDSDSDEDDGDDEDSDHDMDANRFDYDHATASSQASGTPKVPPDMTLKQDVVANLFKIYMVRGDLERYREHWNRAEKNYLCATKLAPGKGHVYNQLAAVAYHKTFRLESLYWYARCLLVTHEPFSASQVDKNLLLLAEGNRNQIEEYHRGGTPIVLELKDTTKKDEIKARRSQSSKSCSAFFTDLICTCIEILREKQKQLKDGKKPASYSSVLAGTDEDANLEATLQKKLDDILPSFESLLRHSALGEPIVCKKVVISAWLVQLSRDEQDEMLSRLSWNLLFSLGSTIAECLHQSLTEKLEKATASKAPPSVKYLVAFEILIEFVQFFKNSRSVDFDDTKVPSQAVEARFWKSVVIVGNMVRSVMKRYGVVESASDESGSFASKLQEYCLLKGCRIFPVVNEGYEPPAEVYLASHLAIEALELTKAGESQDTRTTSSTATGGAEENKAKLLRMLEICGRLSSDSNFPIGRTPDGNCFIHSAESAIAMSVDHADDHLDDLTGHDTVMDLDGTPNDEAEDNAEVMDSNYEMDDEAGDVVVYKSQSTGGPALLVPGDLLAGSGVPRLENGDQAPGVSTSTEGGVPTLFGGVADANPKANNENSLPAVALPPPPGIKPPPGFESVAASPVVTLPPQQQGMHDPLTESMLGRLIGGQNGQGSQNSQTVGHSPHYPDPLFLNTPGVPGPGPTVGQSIDLFVPNGSELQTANPFVPKDYQLQMSSSLFQNIVQQESEDNVDGVNWLDAGLLNSLWMDESKPSKNPWAK